MYPAPRFLVSLLVVVVLFSTLLSIPAAATSTEQPGPNLMNAAGSGPMLSETGERHVVDATGPAEYESIQVAVDAAAPGDTVLVRPGRYNASVTVSTDIEIVAPTGATLDGTDTNASRAAIRIEGDSAVSIDGFRILGYTAAVDGYSTSGNWVVRNTTIHESGWGAIRAVDATGDWYVENVTIRNATIAINAEGANGDWGVTDTVIQNSRTGVDASSSDGNWTIENTTITDSPFFAVSASYSTGDWRIANSTIRETTVGVDALETTGDWLIWRSTIANTTPSDRYDFLQPPLAEGVGIHASRSNGSWRVHHTRFYRTTEGGILATDADQDGDARQNWWGDADGAHAPRCEGAVDCSNRLSEWPPADQAPLPTQPTTPTTTDTSSTSTSKPASAGKEPRTTAPSTTAPAQTGSPISLESVEIAVHRSPGLVSVGIGSGLLVFLAGLQRWGS